MSQPIDGAPARAHKPHILPLKVYFMVASMLIVLTYVTIEVSYHDFGTLNLIVAMTVASIKASLVALFFMHLKYDERFNAVVFVGSLAFLGIFFALTLADTVERGSVDPVKAREIVPVPGRPEFMDRYGTNAEGAPDAAVADSTAAADSTADAGGATPEAAGGGSGGGGH